MAFVFTVIVENGVRPRLNIVDIPGYGDQINNEGCWDTIIKYIKDQHSTYLRKELTTMRDKQIQDTRIHCCLFFINPTGNSCIRIHNGLTSCDGAL
ncbi:cell division control protein [Tulasnella sp. 424]|nr:cell division control protein [Tulasnella sp. 424]KAG8976584.1 cell division control protein [Tulasnella sp. 425]